MSILPAISVRDLVKRYKGSDRNAVDGVSFTVEQGSLFALLGPNGAGKTTTISILTTTLAATSGSVQIAGADLAKEQSEVRRRVGIIFQKPSLDRALTGEENCRFHAALYGAYAYRPTFGLMPQEYRDRVIELGALVGLDRDGWCDPRGAGDGLGSRARSAAEACLGSSAPALPRAAGHPAGPTAVSRRSGRSWRRPAAPRVRAAWDIVCWSRGRASWRYPAGTRRLGRAFLAAPARA